MSNLCKQSLLFPLLIGLFFNANAQRRYLDPFFENVQIQNGVVYGQNTSVLLLSAGHTFKQSLKMDVYSPEGDTETGRPLIIILHSGNFLPPQAIGACEGTTADADNVALATRLAKMGYVVAVADYRLGWYPLDIDLLARRFSLVNAFYRAVQDSRTCVRFFRRSHAEGNLFGIDPEKITLWGFDTGAHIALSSAMLDSVSDFFANPMFLIPPGVPMIDESINGDINATSLGIAPPNQLNYPAFDTICYPNHVGFSSDFALTVNLGGGIADTNWIDASDGPVISFHAPHDVYSPCACGFDLPLPPPYQPIVMEFCGSCSIQSIVNQYNLNHGFQAASAFADPYSVRARALNGGIESFFPFYGVPDWSPWAYANSPAPYSPNPFSGPCDTGSVVAARYLDTVLAYVAPRMCLLFGLPDCSNSSGTASPEPIGLLAAPNPAGNFFSLKTNDLDEIRAVEIFDARGRCVRFLQNIKASSVEIERGSLPDGLYWARAWVRDAWAMAKVVLR